MDSPTTTTENGEPVAAAGPTPAGPAPKGVRIAMAATWTLVILFLCWMPGQWVQEVEGDSPWFQIPDLDKAVHWGIFVLFTVLWLRTSTSRWRYLWIAAAGVFLAALTEMVQQLPAIGRDGEVGDAITDLIGVAIGLAIARWVEPSIRWAESLMFRGRGA